MERMIFLDTVPSTNDYAKDLARQGAAHGTAVMAKSQTAGRGRMGRSFLSPEGGLYLSVILRPRERAEELMALTAVLAAAVCDAVEQVCGIRPGVKWINDLVLDGKKLAGVLTELSLTADGYVDYAVCGIGINCNGDIAELSPQVQEIATSLLVHTGKRTDLEALAKVMASRIVRACDTAVREKTVWMERYRKNCVTLGKTVRVLGAEPYEATALNVDGDGALQVRTADGKIHKIFSGEVSVRGLFGYI